MWICDALCVFPCVWFVRSSSHRVRAAMAEEEDEEEDAAAATPSLRQQGNNHNASFTAENTPAAI